ncbi:MAG: hypothetical protein ABL888_22645, partial [Pirellulaceae bacterium]
MTESTGRLADGQWVYLSNDDARKHPLYGVKGWALVLVIVLVLEPLGLARTIAEIWLELNTSALKTAIINRFGRDILLVFGISVALCSISVLFIFQKRHFFQNWFYITQLIIIFLSIYIQGNLLSKISQLTRSEYYFSVPSFIISIVPFILWFSYVYYSKRINVTMKRRIRTSDIRVPDNGTHVVNASPATDSTKESGNILDVRTSAEIGEGGSMNERWETHRKYNPKVDAAAQKLSELSAKNVEVFSRLYVENPSVDRIDEYVQASIEAVQGKHFAMNSKLLDAWLDFVKRNNLRAADELRRVISVIGPP